MTEIEPVSGDELFNTVSNPVVPNDKKLNIIKTFKKYVKREFLDVSQIPQYFQALAIAVESPEISATSFNVLCSLIRRVTTQDKTGNILQNQASLVLPILIGRLGDSSNSTVILAKSALEGFYLLAPKAVIPMFNSALAHRNPKIIMESINLLTSFEDTGIKFDIRPYLACILESCNKNYIGGRHDVVDSFLQLISKYYSTKDKSELIGELQIKDLTEELRYKFEDLGFIVGEGIDRSVPRSERIQSRTERIPSRTERIPSRGGEKFSSKPPSRAPSRAPSRVPSREIPKVLPTEIKESDPNLPVDLQEITSKLLSYPFDLTIKPKEVSNPDNLYRITDSLLPAFENRETEHNWGIREKSIITIRQLARGNAPEFLEDFKQCIRTLTEGICKSISSLRTTLSSHGCQLVKELVMILGTSFDPLMDLFLPTLFKLCSATKNIASQQAHTAICSIFLNCSYYPRYLTRINGLSMDKNIKVRSYSATWLQILVIRFDQLLASQGFEIISKTLSKLLADPNPSVRSNSKDTYWTFIKYFPNEQENLLMKLEPNIIKAIERSKPSSSGTRSNVVSRVSHQKSYSYSSPYTQVRPEKRSSLKETTKNENERQTRVLSDPIIRDLSSREVPKNKELPKLAFQKLPDSYEEPPFTPSFAPLDEYNKNETISKKSLTPPVYKTQDDPIVIFLSKPDKTFLREGISLVGYAIDEDLPKEVNDSLTRISKTDIELLSPLFAYKLSKVIRFFSHADFFRIIMVLKSIDEPLTKELIDLLERKEVYDSINGLLSYCNSVEGTDKLLVEQAIKYKSIIIKSIMEFMVFSLDIMAIDDANFSSTITSLFNLVNLVKSTPLYELYSKLLQKLYGINQDIFATELSNFDSKTKDEVSLIVDMDSITELTHTLTQHSLTKDLDFRQISGEFLGIKSPQKLSEESPKDVMTGIRAAMDQEFKQLQEEQQRKVEEPNNEDVNMEDGEVDIVPQEKEVDVAPKEKEESLEMMTDTNEDVPLYTPVDVPHSEEVMEEIMQDDMEDISENTSESKEPEAVVLEILQGEAVSVINENQIEKGPDQPQSDSIEQENINQHVNMEIDTEAKSIVTEDKIEDQNSNHKETEPVDSESTPNIAPDIPESIPVETVELVPEIEPEMEPKVEVAEEIVETKLHGIPPKSPHPSLRPSPLVESFDDKHENVFYSPDRPVSNGKELIDSFGRVSISPQRFDPLQNLVDKFDPLKSVSDRSKPINIYEDEYYRGSPKKYNKYNYTELNWFNFQLANLSIDDTEFSRKEYEYYCKRVGDNTIDSTELCKLLSILQSPSQYEMDFTKYFYGEGLANIQDNLWKFFTVNTDNNKLLNGLIILKQLFINRVDVNSSKVFKLLVESSNIADFTSIEFDHAIGEIFDEMIGVSLNSRLELLDLVLEELQPNLEPKKVSFIFECISKLLSKELIHEGLVLQKLEPKMHEYLNHKDIEIRRVVVLLYSSISKMNGDLGLEKLSNSQKKLIEYYSRL